jgi:hypothetical protein
MFENMVLRKIPEPKRDDLQKSVEDYITKSYITCNPQQIMFG